MTMGKRIVDPVALAAMQQAYAEQVSNEVIRRASRYARQRAVMVRQAGRRIDNMYGRELVQDALCDIWSGRIAWDPARFSLLHQVRSVIRSRSWKDAQWAERSPHLSLDVHDTAAAITAEASHQFATPAQVQPFMIRGLTEAVVTELKRLAEGDAAAGAVLRAWADGVVGQGEVMEHTGLSRKEYRIARARLAYLVRELPSSLDDAARTLLRSAS
jgi:hypothetical protein